MHSAETSSIDGYPAVRLTSPAGLEATYAPTANMVGCSLRHDGDELLAQRGGLHKYATQGSTFGIPLLHPWANRLDLATTSPLVRRDANGLPIHGVVPWALDWEAGHEDARLSASARFDGEDLLAVFPHPHTVRMDVALADTTLTVSTTVETAGVPVAFGYHPYLQLPDVPRADWLVTLPVRTRLLLDDRTLPTGVTEPVDEPPRQPLGDRGFDDAYTDLTGEPFALEGGGRRVEVRFTAGYPFAQVYAPPGDDLICFEPMTAPSNALATGHDLPTSPHTASFEITVTAPA
jgi:galactose mutarotase-like enzyme